MTDKIVVFSTCGSEAEASEIALYLVEQRLAACVSILPKVQSIYRWKDKIEESAECLMVIKTRRELFAALREQIRKLHGYNVPEIIALPIVDGCETYLEWLDEQLTKPAS